MATASNSIALNPDVEKNQLGHNIIKPSDNINHQEDINHQENDNENNNDEQRSELGDLKAIQAEDDPHIAAFQDDPEGQGKLSLITFVAFLGLSVVGPITCGQLMIGAVLTNVTADLGGGESSWVISAWGIASSISFAIAGRLSDIFGRRYVILLGQGIAVVGAIVAATAQNIPQLIAGSTIIGLSVGLILVIFTAVPELCPYKYRGVGLAWIQFCLYVPWGAVQALLANALLKATTWRWIYYVAIIYAGISFVGTIFFYFPPSQGLKNSSISRRQAFLQLDFIGIGLYAAGLVIFLLALAWGGTAGHAWKSASVLCPLLLGVATLCACLVYEGWFVDDEHAFFPPHLFKKVREFTVLLVVSFVSGVIYYPNSALLPEATLFVFTNDPIKLGVTLIPNGIGQLIGSTMIPGLLHLTKAPKFFIVLATALLTLFTALYAYGIQGHKGAWMAFQFFGQGSFDWITTCTIVNASLHVRYSDMGLAIGLLGAFRSFGGSVGNAVFQTIKTSILNERLAPGIAAAALAQGYDKENLSKLIPAVISNAAGEPGAFAHVPNVTPVLIAATQQAVRKAYEYAFGRIFYATIPFGVLSIIAAVFIADAGKYMTNHVSVRIQRGGLGRKTS